MLLLATLLLIGFVLFHGIWLLRKAETLRLSLGLIGLGAINSLAGLGVTAAGWGIVGGFVAAVGLVSILLGVILDEMAHGYAPNWDIHAVRIGTGVFIVGLLMLVDR